MGENDRVSQLKARIEQLDKESPSPDDRATVVWNILVQNYPNLTDWDLLCFASSYIGLMTNLWPWLEKPAKELNSLLHTAHYMMTEQHNIATGLKHNGGARGAESSDRERSDGRTGPQENSTRSVPQGSEPYRSSIDIETALHVFNRPR